MKPFATNINAILKQTKESRASLCQRSGVSKTSLADFLNGKNDLSFDAVVSLLNCFKQYNARWLLTGFKSKTVTDHVKNVQKKVPEIVEKPVELCDPSDETVIERFKSFCSENKLEILVRRERIDEKLRWSATTMYGDLYKRFTYVYADTEKEALMTIIKLYSEQVIICRAENKPIQAPDFFAKEPK